MREHDLLQVVHRLLPLGVGAGSGTALLPERQLPSSRPGQLGARLDDDERLGSLHLDRLEQPVAVSTAQLRIARHIFLVLPSRAEGVADQCERRDGRIRDVLGQFGVFARRDHAELDRLAVEQNAAKDILGVGPERRERRQRCIGSRCPCGRWRNSSRTTSRSSAATIAPLRTFSQPGPAAICGLPLAAIRQIPGHRLAGAEQNGPVVDDAIGRLRRRADRPRCRAGRSPPRHRVATPPFWQ